MKIRLPSVVKIALGNLWEHKSKTIILGLLIMIGVCVIVLGNSFLESSNNNIKRDMIANYSGDIMIHGPDVDGSMVTLFGVGNVVNVGAVPDLPAIVDINEVYDILNNYDDKNKVIKGMSPCISAMVMIDTENVPEDFEPSDENMLDLPYATIFAGPKDEYYSLFEGINVTEGDVPSDFEPGILLDNKVRAKFEKYFQISLNVGDKIILTGLYNGSLREVPVVGFYSPKNAESAITDVCYVDPDTARTFANLTYGSVLAEELPETVDVSISDLSEDELFGDFSDDMFDFSESSISDAVLSDVDYDSILGDTSLRDKLNETGENVWNFMLIKLKNSNDAEKVIFDLNSIFAEKNVICRAVPWDIAGWAYVTMTGMLSGVFSGMVFLLAVVVFIVIMNTLIVSVIERTSEIGTMKALGASRSFIKKLFFIEAISISVIASLLGIIIALVLCGVLNACDITIANDNVKVILGSGVIGFIPKFGSILGTFIAIVAGSAFANLYPVSLALRITPLKAMNQE